jgi:hypothetical protein
MIDNNYTGVLKKALAEIRAAGHLKVRAGAGLFDDVEFHLGPDESSRQQAGQRSDEPERYGYLGIVFTVDYGLGEEEWSA